MSKIRQKAPRWSWARNQMGNPDYDQAASVGSNTNPTHSLTRRRAVCRRCFYTSIKNLRKSFATSSRILALFCEAPNSNK